MMTTTIIATIIFVVVASVTIIGIINLSLRSSFLTQAFDNESILPIVIDAIVIIAVVSIELAVIYNLF